MSTLKADTIVASDGSSPVTLTKQSAAKFFTEHNLNMDTIEKSLNASSITDHATGQCSFGITNAMSDTVYPATSEGYDSADDWTKARYYAARNSTTSIDYIAYDGAFKDSRGSIIAHGDLA